VFDDDRIVAVSLLTREEVQVLGNSLKRVYAVPSDGNFDDLLRALDRQARPFGSSPQAPE
jgi:hypothetical protein